MSQTEHDINDAEVIEIQKSYFFDGFQLPVNIYLRLNSGRYILLGKKDERPQFSSLASFQHPKSQIYILKIDHDEFIRYMTNLTEQLMERKELPNLTKAKFVKGLADNVIKQFEKKKFSNEQQLNRVSKMVFSLCQNISNFEDVLGILNELPNDESKHAMSTCMIAMLICEEMEIKQPTVLEKVVKASLLHDIGLKYIPREILDKPQHEWTPEERIQYESHPVKSVEALRDLKEISNDVLLMISEHHENAIGTGYPKKIRDVKISPLGRILIVANYFADLLFERIETTKVYDAPHAIEFIENIVGQPFNKQVFRALKNIINKDEIKRKMKSS